MTRPSEALFAVLLTSSRICTPRPSMPQPPTAELGPVTESSKKAAYSIGYGLIFSVSRALDTARLILNLFCFQWNLRHKVNQSIDSGTKMKFSCAGRVPWLRTLQVWLASIANYCWVSIFIMAISSCSSSGRSGWQLTLLCPLELLLI